MDGILFALPKPLAIITVKPIRITLAAKINLPDDATR
jgi:hypothetical protein